mmetsp:Transcript_23002/g.64653  ORF Transcript_23002/g.64653 Transcript_23002/m.64653 type:complete len:293 (+) Transcript_23002:108-986(+)
MERSSDPALMRVGVCVGSPEDAAASQRLLTTFHEVLARMLNLTRLAVLTLPLLAQTFYLHSIDFSSWVLRLATVYVLIGVTCFVVVPEQLYNGMGLGSFRWLFEKFYPDIALANGTIAAAAERCAEERLGGHRVGELHGLRAKLRWHGTRRYLCITKDGWGVTGDEGFAATLLLQRVFSKDKQVPDTYQFRVCEPSAEWHQAWLSFQPVNHLRFGGWFGAFKDPDKACPYKILQDSSCPDGAFKLLCSWTGIPSPTQRHLTGFYIAEQLSGGHLYVGHASDKDAALLEFHFL